MADGLPLHLYVALSSELNTISCKPKQGVIAHVICSDLFILPLRYLLAVRLSVIQFLHVAIDVGGSKEQTRASMDGHIRAAPGIYARRGLRHLLLYFSCYWHATSSFSSKI